MIRGLKRFALPLTLVLALILAHGAAYALHSTEPNRPTARKPHRKSSHHRRVRWNPLFRPSHDSLLRQNEEVDRLGLPRIVDDEQLEELKSSHALVPIEASETLRFEPGLDRTRRYCRPWTRDFVNDLSEVYYQQFHEQIQVNSAVRTVKVQKKLRRHNRNAAPADGDTAFISPRRHNRRSTAPRPVQTADSVYRILFVLSPRARTGRTRRRTPPLVLSRDGVRPLQ